MNPIDILGIETCAATLLLSIAVGFYFDISDFKAKYSLHLKGIGNMPLLIIYILCDILMWCFAAWIGLWLAAGLLSWVEANLLLETCAKVILCGYVGRVL